MISRSLFRARVLNLTLVLIASALLVSLTALPVLAQENTQPRTPEDHYQLGRQYEQLGKLEAARDAYRQALQGNYFDARYHLSYAHIVEQLDGLDSALYQYQLAFKYAITSAADSYPAIDTLRRLLVQKYIAAGFPIENPEASIRFSAAAQTLDPDNPQICVYLGSAFFQNGEYEKAVHWNRQAIALGYEEGLLYVNIASSMNQLGEFEQGRAMVERALFYDEYDYTPVLVAIAQEPDTFSTWVSFRSAMGDEELKKLVDESPKGLLGRAMYQYDQGNLDKAIEYARKASEVGDVYSYTRIYLGDFLRAAGKSAEAESVYKEALELNKENVMAEPRLGDLYYARGDYQQAITYYEQYLRRTDLSRDGLARVIIRFADSLEETDQVDKAVMLLDQWIASQYGQSPTYEHSMLRLNLLMKSDRMEEAKKSAEWTIQAFSAASDPVLIYASILRQEGKNQEAEKAVNDAIVTIESFIERNPQEGEAYLSLAKLYDAKSRKESAIEVLKKGGLATESWKVFGQELYARQAYEPALDVFGKRIDSSPEAALYFAWIAAESGKRLSEGEKALTLAEGKLGESNVPVQRVKGMMAYGKGDYQKAIEIWSGIVGGDADSVEQSGLTPSDRAFLHQLLGRSYEKMGQNKEALAQFNKAKAIDPNLKQLDEDLNRVQTSQ